ncbi:phenylalanyl-tRNA synthetase [Methylophilales bacterium MBRSG12]|uniref:Phenylalanine--tRNA ligase alpha subunit n=1 Tax=Methylophilales bacterium MBRS-H7 TaxID=1623450 RepID=A0A0H4J359_9PROT|nr:phenylalanyl-tRNA synthetase [Methylophilales bacterium MBRSF5]AKO66198.1 phenylalanyl-tRNA synthetase [Methylophilales bacterium MBRS-H7]AKO67516.1 phenylalanyl-tRNA synthetase [Methylophilales bacterium MBRSG12]
MNELNQLIDQAKKDFASCSKLADLDHIKSKFLGKSGPITEAMKSLASLSPEEKPKKGAEINQVKKQIEALLETRKQEISNLELNEKLEKEKIDVTLPSRPKMKGSLHPVMNTIDEISTIFHGIGFDVADGPEIEDDFHNFTALNIPESHPARAMHDTFYVNKEYVLRTHTSPVQIRYMENNMPPIQIISPGRVYRVDSDATHSPMFHQVEGLVINEDVNFANLKGVVQSFLQSFFEDENLTIRFRPSYFPFTEPSAEIDMSWNDGWLEIGGCGMVHPNVLKHVNIDSEMYQGFAFGLGVERLTMLKYGINDLRHFFNHDLRFLEQFK